MTKQIRTLTRISETRQIKRECGVRVHLVETFVSCMIHLYTHGIKLVDTRFRSIK